MLIGGVWERGVCDEDHGCTVKVTLPNKFPGCDSATGVYVSACSWIVCVYVFVCGWEVGCGENWVKERGQIYEVY